MKIRMLASAPDAPEEHQYLTSFVIDDTVAVDAGGLGLWRGAAEQARIADVLLTHSHMDHVASLPVFLECSRDARGHAAPVRVHGHAFALGSLRTDIFNDRVWPDLFRLAGKEGPHLELKEMEAERTVTVGKLRVTPVEVRHTVPSYGFIVEDGDSAVVFSGDSAPTDRIWELARERGNLRAVFLEATFPDAMQAFALKTGHLTPALFGGEAAKLPPGVVTLAVHIRPRFRARIVAELEALALPNLVVARGGTEYRF
jgi:ribonuclease BN (tRNA processing enzyme)